ncbi:MAG: alpha/beta fold hydrolase [Burkholderiales bacterium]
MQRAPVNGIELEYEVMGAGEPVLMISPVLADGFQPLVSERALTDRCQLITYHKRGWVGSTRTPPPVTIADHAADAAALLEYLKIGRAHVAGHSSGAAVAVQLALDHPHRVQTLALLELSLLSIPAAAGLLEKAGPAFKDYAEGRRDAALATFLSSVSGLAWDACRALLDQRIPGAVAQTIADADTFFGVELPALSAWTFGAEQAARVSQPVLSVVGGETQPLWVEVADRLRSWFGQVEECTIDGVGHLLHIQRSAPVASCLGAFFARHALAARSTSQVVAQARV